MLALLLAGCASGSGEPAAPQPPFVPSCGDLEAPAGRDVLDVDQGPNTYDVAVDGDVTDAWTLKATVDAPRGIDARVVVEGVGAGLGVAEGVPSLQPVPVEPLCQGYAEFPMRPAEAPGRVIVTFLAAEPEDPELAVPVAVRLVDIGRGNGTLVAHVTVWEPQALRGPDAAATLPGHYLLDVRHEVEVQQRTLALMLSGDAIGRFVLHASLDGAPSPRATLRAAQGSAFTPQPGHLWDAEGPAAAFVVDATGEPGALELQWEAEDGTKDCLRLRMQPSRTQTTLRLTHQAAAC